MLSSQAPSAELPSASADVVSARSQPRTAPAPSSAPKGKAGKPAARPSSTGRLPASVCTSGGADAPAAARIASSSAAASRPIATGASIGSNSSGGRGEPSAPIVSIVTTNRVWSM
jgi:hypothetical protein